MIKRDVVVVGASAGGLAALSQICSQLPADFAACVLVVQHIGRHSSSLPSILSSRGALKAIHPSGGEPLQAGAIYVAPPDRHMLIDDGKIRLTDGPKEHHTRPAIDPLFRSAALACGPRVIGVVLTGHLDDGTFGLQAIQQCGGITVVQDPADAQASGMPTSALQHVAVDHCVGVNQLAATLMRLTQEPVADAARMPPAQLVAEHLAALDGAQAMDKLSAIARPSHFVCPECTGSLWEIMGSKPARYRCHTRHAYSLRSLVQGLANESEATLWSALRALHDLELVTRKLAEDARSLGDGAAGLNADAQAERVAQKAAQVRSLLEPS